MLWNAPQKKTFFSPVETNCAFKRYRPEWHHWQYWRRRYISIQREICYIEKAYAMPVSVLSSDIMLGWMSGYQSIDSCKTERSSFDRVRRVARQHRTWEIYRRSHSICPSVAGRGCCLFQRHHCLMDAESGEASRRLKWFPFELNSLWWKAICSS